MKRKTKHIKIIRTSTVPTSLETFLKGFLKKLSTSYEVVAVSSPGEPLEIIHKREGIRTVEVPMERHISIFKDVMSLLRLIIVFYKEQPTIVHSITPKAGLLSMLAAWITRVPIRIHTFTGLVFPTSTGIKRSILMFMDKLTCGCATYINPESKGVAKDLKQFGITSKELHIIANGNVRGIDMEYYQRTDEVMRQSQLLKLNQGTTFCFVGRIVGDKGINELVRAFDKLTQTYKDVNLLLVGSFENQLDPLSEATNEILHNNQHISCLGEQPDVRPYLAASDIFVFPSYREGMPNVVLEAGAMGLPCIVTDINGSNEIIIEGENGEIIPVRDEEALFEKMRDWVAHPEEVRGMAQNARRMIAERYEQQLIWNSLLDVYNNLSKGLNC